MTRCHWHPLGYVVCLFGLLPMLANSQAPAQQPFRPDRPPGGPGRSPGLAGASRPTKPPEKSYGQGSKELTVDAGKRVGLIHSLLGVNRGPLSFPHREGERQTSQVENYRRFGIDYIRTHDFYGPTDWWTIFPDWKADPLQAASYDFAESDTRIQAIVTNGFHCFFRLGTSWRGRQIKPINDPPGTVRDGNGRVSHAADREDFRKWAQICVQTVRHYTAGWNGGYHAPIAYWEIWNEPDLREQFWTGTPEQFWQLFEEAAKALKEAFPKLKVGGPGCTGAFREPYVDGLIKYCRDHQVPLDFYSWHSYGRPGEFNPYHYYKAARTIRDTLDQHGFQQAENICTEWNAGIRDFIFSDTPAGAAYYASTLACMLDAGLSRAFQYCGDRHPGLGMHDLQTGEPKRAAWAFAAWKRLLETPERLAATGSDERGYNLVAGMDASRHRVRALISDFQSAHDAFRLTVTNLPWDNATAFKVRWLLLDKEKRLALVEESVGQGRTFATTRPFACASVCVVELEQR